ncbi:FAD-dependent oxidoreductase [Terrilactibacillus sp. BCM23-1]|uniref:FAD-dependent oxidoreductase n=1 Tax=Terrilactibacillus tamarindi TaxID=2599694 RepID=A0A6N8CRU9_9BACI|nr:NAD(P)-dependent oxidoreductase [Terrilactibacillus tamarindi]MTT30706.1 FAD-dependent oxidoreductase [Terrilactibacillus tamarindi]
MKSAESEQLTAVDLKRNFFEVKEDMKPKEAIDEANRCLYCYDAPCMNACPTGIDVPSFIKKIATGNLKGSARDILDANPVGATCSRVCPTSELCEGACVLNDVSMPIRIGDLQRHATNWAMEHEVDLFEPGVPKNTKVAIVGGGPAGLSAARELRRLGHEVTIFEAKEKAGGLDTYGIVSFRLPQSVSLWEVEQVEKLGVDIRTNCTVGKDISPETLKNDFDAVLVTVGMGQVPKLGIEGEDLTGVYDAIQFVENTKTKALTEQFIGKRAVVIGAGNTAIDAATCLIRSGARNVKIIYRRTEEEMTAYPFEFEFAKQDGVEFRWLTQPTKIIGDESGHVRQLECVQMMLGQPDQSGRRRPVPIEDSSFLMDVDIVVRAIGQSRHLDLLNAFGLNHDSGVLQLNADTYQTSSAQIFAAGDVVYGSTEYGDAMVVSAAEQGKRAAYAIDKKLSC